jgi:hypothetical protein
LRCSKASENNGPPFTDKENAMLATRSLPFPAPAGRRVFSAGDLCKAVLAGGVQGGRVDDSGLDRVLCHDPQRGALEVQAGTPWQVLAAHGGSAFESGTVGDCVATNAPGPDGRPMVAHLRSLTLVTADGELRRASRDQAPELFRLAVGGFGVFGPFYSVTLDLRRWRRPSQLRQPGAGVAERRPTACNGVDLLVPPNGQAAHRQARAILGEHRYALVRLEVRRTLPRKNLSALGGRGYATCASNAARVPRWAAASARRSCARGCSTSRSRRAAPSRRPACRRRAARRPPPATRCSGPSSRRSGATIPRGA